MSQPIVIGLLGRAGSGKSTAAKHIIENYNAKSFSFAKPLKDLTKLLFDFSDEQVFGTQAQKEAIDPRYNIAPRTAMIRLGDGAREKLWKRIWIDACFNQIQQDYDDHMARQVGPNEIKLSPLYIIEDVRYPNEASALASSRRFSGYVIKLVCPDSDSSLEFTNAPSERSVDECAASDLHATVVSSKSPGSVDLKNKVESVLSEIIRLQLNKEGAFDAHPY